MWWPCCTAVVTLVGLFVSLHVAESQSTWPDGAKNVLYIVSDDMRVELPMYGQKHVYAPALSRIAHEGITFGRAYCNQPLCSPSRNSFMTGRRPSHTRIWNFISDFRAVGPHWTTLPGHFKANGYLTLGTGKLYHEGHPSNGDGNLSWSPGALQFSCTHSAAGPPGTYCDPASPTCHVNGTAYAPNPQWCTDDAPLNGSGTGGDAETLSDALHKLKIAGLGWKTTGRPFFLGVGLRKPHLDWRVPAGWLKHYPESSIRVATHPTAQPGRPPVSIHCPYYGASFSRRWAGWGYRGPWTPMRNTTAREMRQFYYAATSYADGLIGELLEALDVAGLRNDTLVVFHSDHGTSCMKS